MSFLDTYLVHLLIGLAALAILLGLAARFILLRLVQPPAKSANDSVYERKHDAWRARPAEKRRSLGIVEKRK